MKLVVNPPSITTMRLGRPDHRSSVPIATDAFPIGSPAVRPKLKQALREARAAYVPESYIRRVMQVGEQGVGHVDVTEYDTEWTGEAYQTVSGQNSNNSVRVPNSFFEALDRDAGLVLKEAE